MGNIVADWSNGVIPGVIGTVGTLFGLPEMGYSENYAASQTPSIGTQSTNPALQPGTSVDQANQVLGAQAPPQTTPQPTTTTTTNKTTNQTTQTPTQQQPSGPSAEEQLRTAVSSIFDPVFAALSGQESTLNTNLGITNSDIEQQYQTSAGNLASQNKSSNEQLNQLGTEAQNTKTDAWTAARRLYDELSRGGQQRFGGASSAGEAYGALTAVEQQRRQGTIQSAYDTAMQKIAYYKNDLLTKYNEAVKELESQKTTALNTARQQFNDAIQAIQNAKSQAQSDKASATLNTLQEFRNKIYTINLQAVQFAQTLASNKDASLAQVDKYTQQMVNNLTSGNNQVIQLGSLANQAAGSTKLGIGTSGSAPTVTYTGQMQSRPGQKWDESTQSWVTA